MERAISTVIWWAKHGGGGIKTRQRSGVLAVPDGHDRKEQVLPTSYDAFGDNEVHLVLGA